MYKRADKEKYEKLIQESPLFSLDKKAEPVAFRNARLKMIENLYLYLLSINKEKYEPYGCEITETANRCIDTYDCARGEFLNFFNYAWKKEFKYTKNRERLAEKYRGLHVSENTVRAVRKYIKCAEKIEKKDKPEELYSKLAEAMELPVKTIRELAELVDIQVETGNSISDEDEEELWGHIANNVNIERDFEEKEGAENILNKVDKVFQGLRAKQQPIISDVITTKLWMCLEEPEQRYSFISKEVAEEWNKKGTLPTQRDLAKKYGRDEASISRTVKTFLQKLKKEMEQER